MRCGKSISTYTGGRFWPLDPKPNEIYIEDIAHSLSLMNRYNGHSLFGFSVAQHCVLVASKCSKKNKLWGLMHDATEAFCADVNGRIKQTKQFTFYRKLEKGIQKAICKRFGLPFKEPAEVRKVDKKMLFTEARVLMKDWEHWEVTHRPYEDVVIAKWTPERAEEEFLKAFYALGGKYVV